MRLRTVTYAVALSLVLGGCTCEDEHTSTPRSGPGTDASAAAGRPPPSPVPARPPAALAGEVTLYRPSATLRALQRFAAAASVAEAATLDEAALRRTLLGPLQLEGGAAAVDLAQPVRLLVLDPAAHPTGQVLVLDADSKALLQGARRRTPPAPGNAITASRGATGAALHVNPVGPKRLALSEDARAFPVLEPYLRGAAPRPVAGDLAAWLYGNAIFDPPVTELQRLTAGQLAWLARSGVPGDAVTRLRAQAAALANGLLQVERTELGLDLDAASLHAHAGVTPTPGSAWARFNQDQASGPLPFVPALSSDALVAAAGQLHLGQALPLALALIEELFSFSPKRKSEARAQLREVAAGLDGRLALLAGEGASREGPYLVAVLGAPKPTRVRDHLLRLVDGFGSTPLVAALGRRGVTLNLRVERGADKHGKRVLDRVRLDTRALPLVPTARRLLEAALGGAALELWLAMRDDAVVVGLGQGGRAELAAALDRLEAPAPAASPMLRQLDTAAPRSGVLLLWPGAIALARSAPPLRIELWTEGAEGRLSLDLAAAAVAQVLGLVRGEAYHKPAR